MLLFVFFFKFRKYNTATDEDLYEAIDSFQSHFVIHKPNFPKLSDIFRSWANNEGFPILNVKYVKNSVMSNVRISQELFLPNLNETEVSNFIIPYNFVTSKSIDENDWNPEFNGFWRSLNGIEDNFTSSTEANWMIFNIQQTGKRSFF